MVPDRGRGHAERVEGVHHRSALELVRDQGALELVARVDEQRLASALPRIAADGVHPAAQPFGASDGVARPGSERARRGRREQRAVHVVDPHDDEAPQSRLRGDLLGVARGWRGRTGEQQQGDRNGAESGHPGDCRRSPVWMDRSNDR